MENNKSKYDLTIGDILPKLIKMSLPIMGTAFMMMAYNLTDMFWLGRLSSGSVAAAGTSGMYIWLSMAFIFIGRMGAEIGVSQSMGKGDTPQAKKYAQNALFVSLILGVAYGLTMAIFRSPLIAFFNINDATVVREAEEYLLVVAISMPFIFVQQVITGIFNGYGNTKLLFYINCTSLLFNIIISPIFIFDELILFNTTIIPNGFGLGIIGAAASTVIAQVLNLMLKLWAITLYKNRPFTKFRFIFKPSLIHIKQIFAWGIPVAIESMLFTFLFMIVSRLVAEYGVSAIAAQRVGTQVEQISWMMAGGFATAVTAFIGQNFGAKKWARLHAGYRLSMLVMIIYGILVSIILFVFANQLISIFLDNPYEIQMGGNYLRIFAFTQILTCMEGVAVGAFRGQGLTIKPTIASVSGNILRVIFAYTLSTALGLDGIWLGMALSVVLRAGWLIIWYHIYAKKLPKNDTTL